MSLLLLLKSPASSGGGGTPQTPTRVQSAASTNYAFTNVNTYTAPAWGTPPTAGNVLLFCASIDKAGGAANPGITAGWTIRAYQNGLSGSTEGTTILVATKTAVGGDAPPTITWTAASQTGGGANGILQEWSAVDTTTPLAPVVVSPYTGTAVQSISAGPLTPDTSGGRVLAFFTTDSMPSGQPASAFSPAATGWTPNQLGAAAINTGAGTPGAALIQRTAAPVAGTAVPATTFTWTNTADEAQAVMFVLRGAGGAAGTPTPVLVHRDVGISDPTAAYVAVKATDATSVRLKVGADDAVTAGVVWGPAVTPSADGYAQLTVTGLTAGSSYAYRVAMTDADGAEVLDTLPAVGRLRTAPAGAASYGVDFGSCTNDASSPALLAIAGLSSHLFLNLGDFPQVTGGASYADGESTTLENFRSIFGSMLQRADHAAVHAQRPGKKIPSDHDAFVNNGAWDTNPTAWGNYNAVYREVFASPRIPATRGVYDTWTWGRVRYVAIDTRSFKSDPALADTSSKRCLGAVQEQWLTDTISGSAEKMIVIVNPDPWVGAAAGTDDGWFGYDTERQRLGTFFAAQQAAGKKIVMLAGDMHALAVHNGTSPASPGSPGGIRVWHAAPLINNASQKGGPYTSGPYPATGTAVVSQYGHIDVADDGTTVTLTFEGRSSDGTVRVTDTVSVVDSPTQDLTRTLTDSAGIVDSATTRLDAARTLTDSAGISDSASTVLDAGRQLTDSAAITDSASTALAAVRQLSDAAALTDSVSTALDAVRTLSDAAAITDSATWTLTQSTERTLSDSAAITESISTQLAAVRELADAAGISESITTRLDAVRTLTDSAAIVDSLTAVLAASRQLVDGAAITDSASTVLDAVRTLTDAAAITDSASTVLDAQRGLSDAAAITDSATWRLDVVRTLTDNVAITDSASTVVDARRELVDNAAITDQASASLATEGGRQLSDSAAITDSATWRIDRYVTLVDSAAITDSVTAEITAGAEQNTRSLSDSATITDSATWRLDAVRQLSDSAAITDSATTDLRAGGATLVDHAAITDSISWRIDRHITLVDSAAITDSATVARHIFVTLVDSAGIVDSATAVITVGRNVIVRWGEPRARETSGQVDGRQTGVAGVGYRRLSGVRVFRAGRISGTDQGGT